MTAIGEWLEGLGLGQFTEAFEAEQIDLDALPDITEQDLKDMGLPIGPRRKILRAIDALGSSINDPAPPSLTSPLPEPSMKFVPDAERRQITVMFCDLVGSTALSEQLDPEDLRDLMQAYQQACGAVVERYEGHVAQYLGDGLMVYFGWPRAHEDDAERAVRAALDIVGSVKAVDAPTPLQVRLGVATGPVVVGETGGGDASVPKLAVGETPNLAARVQGLAAPDEIIVAPVTRDLIGALFDTDDLGLHGLKGIIEPVRAWRVNGLARVQGRFAARRAGVRTAIMGRDSEITLIMDRWQRAKDGEGQVVLLSGEAGIGKSRLAQEVRERIASEGHTRLLYQCTPFHANAAFHPIIEQLRHALDVTPADPSQDRLYRLETLLAQSTESLEEVIPLLASLLSLSTEGRYPALDLSPRQHMEQTIGALVAQVLGLAKSRPVLIILEDAHWIDPTTLETFGEIIASIHNARVLIIITHRPTFVAPWTGQAHVAVQNLSPLSRRQGAAMVAQLTDDKTLPREILDRIVDRTDGVPLFVEELTRTVLEEGSLSDAGDHYELAVPLQQFAVPATLQDSLTERLDRLGPAKEVAQVAACIGRRFSRSLLAAVSSVQGTALDASLDTLVGSGLVYVTGSGADPAFAFKHALVQETTYAGLLRRTKQRIRATIADRLIEDDQQGRGCDPLAVADHLIAADKSLGALPWLRRAAAQAVSAGALREASDIHSRALILISELNKTAETRQAELEILIDSAPVKVALTGWGTEDIRTMLARALQLAVQLGDTSAQSMVLYHIATMHEVRGEFALTQDTLARRKCLLGETPQRRSEVESNELLACSTFHQGRFDSAISHAENALDRYQAAAHRLIGINLAEDIAAACEFWIAKALLLQGQIGAARARFETANAAAHDSPHWFARSHAELEAAVFYAYLRDSMATLKHAARAAEMSEASGLAYRETVSALIAEWAQLIGGDRPVRLDEFHRRLNLCRSVGAMIDYPFFLGLLTEAFARAGDADKGLSTLNEALALCRHSQGFFFESELHRLGGEAVLLSRADQTSDAETRFARALDVAKAQGARLLELRAANSLARLWQSQGEHQQAYDLLAPVYEWFTEGFDVADLTDAKALLDVLK